VGRLAVRFRLLSSVHRCSRFPCESWEFLFNLSVVVRKAVASVGTLKFARALSSSDMTKEELTDKRCRPALYRMPFYHGQVL
jgi:hypothetical protein